MDTSADLRLHYSNNAIYFQDAFPNDLREYALTVLDTHYPIEGFVGDDTKGGVRIVDPNMRQSEVRFIHLKNETKPIFDWISNFGNEYRWYFSGKFGKIANLKNKVMSKLSPEPIQILHINTTTFTNGILMDARETSAD
tara:strand:+ start:927 stop:1343 length:417 start_codon:yes stop_codon:yes gene_type:complete